MVSLSAFILDILPISAWILDTIPFSAIVLDKLPFEEQVQLTFLDFVELEGLSDSSITGYIHDRYPKTPDGVVRSFLQLIISLSFNES